MADVLAEALRRQELVREIVRASGSVQPADGTALDCVLDLCEAGYSLSASGDTLLVRAPEGVTMPAELRGRVAKHKWLILAVLKKRPEAQYPIDWRQEWRLEMDALLRTAAAGVPESLRAELFALAARPAIDEAGWMALGAALVDLEFRIKEETGQAQLPRPSLTPWQGWIRLKGGAWSPVATALSDDWDSVWAVLIKETSGVHCEKLVMPAGRHPGGRKP